MYVNGMQGGRRTQAERRATTRQALVAAAREAFAARGYHAAAVEEIAQRAGVTRGALYHHFAAGKADLLRAVVEEIEAEIDGLVAAAAEATLRDDPDPVAAFMAGTSAFLDACLQPDVQRILLVDAPAALGWAEWRRIDARHAVGQIAAGLTALMDRGALDRQPVVPLAHLLHGAIIAAALSVAAADPAMATTAREETGAALRRLLAGLCR